MSSSVFFGGSLIAAVIAGMVALVAPCCVSVMLPSYLAASAHNRGLRAAMALIYGAGVATIILPIAMGASLLRRTLVEGHTWIYLAGGSILVAMGIYTVAGGSLRIPSPTGRTGRRGPWSTYMLGVFSAIATSCCAPVLAGVIALSSATGSFLTALTLGTAYVVGMVAPLALMAAFSERAGSTRLLRLGSRSVTYRVGSRRRTISAAQLASGVLLIVMGGWSVALARSNSMRAGSGWQARLSVWATGIGQDLADALSWLPGWAFGALFAALVFWTVRRALTQLSRRDDPSQSTEPASEENPVDINI